MQQDVSSGSHSSKALRVLAAALLLVALLPLVHTHGLSDAGSATAWHAANSCAICAGGRVAILPDTLPAAPSISVECVVVETFGATGIRLAADTASRAPPAA